MLGVPLTFVPPCSPIPAARLPAGDAWLHEPKLDGYRLQVIKAGRKVRLYNRCGNEWTARLPGLVDALAGITCKLAIIDSELCLQGTGSAPDFARLQLALAHHHHDKLRVFAFDLLHWDGKDLRQLPLTKRRQYLEYLLTRSKVPCLRLVDTFANGEQLLEVAARHGIEGVVSKRKASPYRSGPSRDWHKVKTARWRAANPERWRLFESQAK
jgi:bifunctional non-homologous end joining protein LigD